MTTTYASSTAGCFRCRQPVGWCLTTCPNYVPKMMAHGEIDLGNGRTMVIPVRQPGDWQAIPSAPDPLDGLTITGVIRAVSEGPESHAEARTRFGGVPARYVVLVLLGIVLTGIGMSAWMIGPLIYGAIPR